MTTLETAFQERDDYRHCVCTKPHYNMHFLFMDPMATLPMDWAQNQDAISVEDYLKDCFWKSLSYWFHGIDTSCTIHPYPFVLIQGRPNCCFMYSEGPLYLTHLGTFSASVFYTLCLPQVIGKLYGSKTMEDFHRVHFYPKFHCEQGGLMSPIHQLFVSAAFPYQDEVEAYLQVFQKVAPQLESKIVELISKDDPGLKSEAYRNLKASIKPDEVLAELQQLRDLFLAWVKDPRTVYEPYYIENEVLPKELPAIPKTAEALKSEIDIMLDAEHTITERLERFGQLDNPKRIDLYSTEHDHYDTTSYCCCAFRRKQDKWKTQLMPFGNMNSGFPFSISGKTFLNSECAYISGLFSGKSKQHMAIQEQLLNESNGYMAKKNIRAKNENIARKDWEEFNIDWMLFVVWQKVQQNQEFRELLLSFPAGTIFIEDVSLKNKPKEGADKNVVWGCRNESKKRFYRLVKKYADTLTFPTKKAKTDFINEYLWQFCNYGEYVGQNIMGKILTIVADCWRNGTVPPFNKKMLWKKQIYLLGKRVHFDEPSLQTLKLSSH